jgi:hypothetical protein
MKTASEIAWNLISYKLNHDCYLHHPDCDHIEKMTGVSKRAIRKMEAKYLMRKQFRQTLEGNEDEIVFFKEITEEIEHAKPHYPLGEDPSNKSKEPVDDPQ